MLAPALALALALPAPARAQPPTMTITLAGQSMIRSDIRVTAPAAVPAIRALLKGDVAFTDLEGTVAEPGQRVHAGRGFLAPPAALDALASFGFNLLALADNHAFDMQVSGIRNTIREADRRHLVHAGTGETLAQAATPAYLHTPAGTVALVASASGLLAADARAMVDRPGVNELRIEAGDRPNEGNADLPGAPANVPDRQDAGRILQSIREARRHADVVVVYQHNHVFGNEAFSTLFSEGMPQRLAPDPWLQRWTHAEIDAGADIVVMHGAPLLHGVEIYHGRPIFYDLGNFIYNLPPTLTYIDEPMSWESAVATVRFQGGVLRSVTLRPIVLNTLGEGQPDAHDPYDNNQFLDTRGLPAPATGPRATYILKRLAELSKPFGTVMDLRGDESRIDLAATARATH
jgi:poly-gamma-glutamate synthesis protein (capsule biosynthesis protein)